MSNEKPEPFGYFKAEPFGWRDCAETDEGAIALYEAPQSQADALDAEPMWLQVDAEVRYWEDATVNGDEDTEGDLIPLKQGNRWVPVIRLADGFIAGWPQGVSADIHYKVCDQGEYFLINAALQRVSKYRSYYVPSMLSVGDDGYDDYIILKVNGDGFIEGWTRPVIDEEMWEPIDRAAIATAKEADPRGADALDAERWRFIKRKLCLTGNGDGTCAMQALNLPARILGWPDVGESAMAQFLDTAIDAAIAAAKENK